MHSSYYLNLILSILKTDVLLYIIVENVVTVHFQFMENSSWNILLNVLLGEKVRLWFWVKSPFNVETGLFSPHQVITVSLFVSSYFCSKSPVKYKENSWSPPLPYSIARYKCLLVSSTSYRRTMFGWERFSMQMISEANRFWDFLSRRAFLRIFTATRSVRQREGIKCVKSQWIIFGEIHVIQT